MTNAEKRGQEILAQECRTGNWAVNKLFPDRKRPAICVQKGNKIKIYGYFQSVEAAQEFMHELAILVKAKEE